MNPLVALLLGIVEGLTEYLPVSSTGHLDLTSKLLERGFGVSRAGAASFEIVIQLGAILAVVVEYRVLLLERAKGLVARRPEAVALLVALSAGFLPTAVAGLLFRKAIKSLLEGSALPVAGALVVGGVVMIASDFARRGKPEGLVGLEHVTPRRALAVGIGQCFALWPGVSRSMSTILAGQLVGLSTTTAAEFSFLLGLPTLGAATILEAYKSRDSLASDIGALSLAIGLVTSFVVAWAVIRGFVAYLKKRGLAPFGVYRIVVGVAAFYLLAP